MSFPEAAIDRALKAQQRRENLYALWMVKAAIRHQAEDTAATRKACLAAFRYLPLENRNRFVALTFLQLGLSRDTRQDQQRAIGELHLSDSLFQLAGDGSGSATAKLAIVELERVLWNFQEALKNISEAEAAATSNAALWLEARIVHCSLLNQGSREAIPHLLEEESKILAEIFQLPFLHRYPDLEADAWAEQGMLDFVECRYEKAAENFKKAAAYFKEHYKYKHWCNQRINLMYVMWRGGDNDATIREAEELLKITKEYGFPSRDHEIYGILVDAYLAKKDYYHAYYRQGDWIVEQTSRMRAERANVVLGLEAKYESSEKETALQLAEQDKANLRSQSEARERQVAIWRWVVALIALLLFAVLALAMRARRANLRVNAQADELAQQNQVIQKSLEEKEHLYKELHHRVKNNLQLLMGFMSLQRSHRPDYKVDDFINDIEKKIRAMALVHEQLHQTSDVGRVMLKQYFSDIAENLIGTYSASTSNVNLSVEGEELELNIEQAIPLGLIINEIVTNSIKYAFPNNAMDGEISMQLRHELGKRVIEISDNGIGLPANFDPSKSTRIGSKIIVLLARQISAKVEFFNHNGAVWRLQLA